MVGSTSLVSGALRSALVLSLFVAGGCISSRAVFTDMTYPEEDAPSPPPLDREFSLGASLLPILVEGYAEPHAVGACFETLAENAPERLGCFASCVQSGTASCDPEGPKGEARTPEDCIDALRGWVVGDCPAVERDRPLLVYALAEAGETLLRYSLAVGRSDPDLPHATRQSFLAASFRLGLDPHPSTERHELPFLALSGGSGNGAFIAGYFHAMLSAREYAAAQGADVSRERFGGSVGTSVGALVTQLLDLYFTDPQASANGCPIAEVLAELQCLEPSADFAACDA